MVVILPPPPLRPAIPLLVTVVAGTRLVRIFDPTRHGATAVSFRHNGPRARFDHHRGHIHAPADDPERGVYYASCAESPEEAFVSCFVEVFGDSGVVVLGNAHVAMPLLARDITLLDLRYVGAMRAGTVAAIAKCDHAQSQPWSRHFYESSNTYGAIDGLLYLNAHNDGPALMLYERAANALTCTNEFIARLDHPTLWPLLVRIMNEHNLVT